MKILCDFWAAISDLEKKKKKKKKLEKKIKHYRNQLSLLIFFLFNLSI